MKQLQEEVCFFTGKKKIFVQKSTVFLEEGVSVRERLCSWAVWRVGGGQFESFAGSKIAI